MGLADHWNTRPEDLEGDWPCDRHGPDDAVALYRAIDVATPPATAFRWLCQLRVAPYSYDWIDNRGRRSPRTLTPGLEQLEAGQTVMSIFKLLEFETDAQLTLEAGRFLSLGPLQVTYRVQAQPGGTRLAAKLRFERPPGLIGSALARGLAIGDWVMMRKQLLTLKKFAEAAASGAPPAAG